jgi:uncharacterized membrane protein
MSFLLSWAQNIGEILDFVGVLVIVGGALGSMLKAVEAVVNKKATNNVYKSFRQNLGRSILLGLEFLVAGDIIRSVTGVPNLTSVVVLVVVVLVRSFLSMTFEMEIEGHWPWQRSRMKA